MSMPNNAILSHKTLITNEVFYHNNTVYAQPKSVSPVSLLKSQNCIGHFHIRLKKFYGL